MKAVTEVTSTRTAQLPQVATRKPIVRHVDSFELSECRRAPKKTTELTEHLADAAHLNFRRGFDYAWRSRGASLPVSIVLILGETFARLYSPGLDRRGRKFADVGIVKNDFYSMKGVPKASAPPKYRNRMSSEDFTQLKNDVGMFIALASMESIRFSQVAAFSRNLLRIIETQEESGQYHLAMTKHVVESIGLCALRGTNYALESEGATSGLTRDLIAYHLQALSWAPWIDRRAQKSHARGVGLLVNDLPNIPFAREFDAAPVFIIPSHAVIRLL